MKCKQVIIKEIIVCPFLNHPNSPACIQCLATISPPVKPLSNGVSLVGLWLPPFRCLLFMSTIALKRLGLIDLKKNEHLKLWTFYPTISNIHIHSLISKFKIVQFSPQIYVLDTQKKCLCKFHRPVIKVPKTCFD